MGVGADGAYAQWESGGCVGGESVFGDMASPIWEQFVVLGLVLLGFLVVMYAGYKLVTR
jgi:hypothetical protein